MLKKLLSNPTFVFVSLAGTMEGMYDIGCAHVVSLHEANVLNVQDLESYPKTDKEEANES